MHDAVRRRWRLFSMRTMLIRLRNAPLRRCKSLSSKSWHGGTRVCIRKGRISIQRTLRLLSAVTPRTHDVAPDLTRNQCLTEIAPASRHSDPKSAQQQGSLIIDWDLLMDPPACDASPCTPCACRDAQVLPKHDLEAALRQSVLHTLQLQSLLLGKASRPADSSQRLRTASMTRPATVRPQTSRRAPSRRQRTASRPQTAQRADSEQTAWKVASWGPGWDDTGPHEQTPRQQLRHSGQHDLRHRPRQRCRSEQGSRVASRSIEPSAYHQLQPLARAVERLALTQKSERAASHGMMANLATELEVSV